MKEKTNIFWLEKFRGRLCDGDWEHSFGFSITTIDNPGWALDFDLNDTVLEELKIKPTKDYRTEENWVFYKKEGPKFMARGGNSNLDEMIGFFRRWVEENTEPGASLWAE